MDPLSATASVIALVQIADRIISACKAYVSGIREAPAELRAILIEVGSVKCVLEVVELIDVPQSDEGSFNILCKLAAPLAECQKVLLGLEALVAPTGSGKGGLERYGISLTNLAWPFKKEKAQRLLEELGRYKTTMSLGLSADLAHDVKYIRTNVEEVKETTTTNLFNETLRWLVSTDPSSNHNSACRLHEGNTGSWLTNSKEYVSWKNGSTECLWLHGIPGAGKTVLASYIIQDVKTFCRASSLNHRLGWGYYYCYFGRQQDETAHAIRSFINQLCRQCKFIPLEVSKLYSEDGEPTFEDLHTALAAIVQKFGTVFIVIDALDESQNRELILDVLLELIEYPGFGRVQWLLTSRKEMDIERALLPVVTDLSLSNSYVDQDIRTYVQRRLRVDHKFNAWPEDLKTEIEFGLVKGAKGMFRWVVCQIELLKRLNTAADIRSALSKLPRTLDETYERVLCNIPEESQDLVFRTLHLIATGYIETLDELQQTLSINLQTMSYNPQNQPLDLNSPIEACTCLLTYDVGKVRFAHYTVKEYLISPRIALGPAKFFQMSEESITCLAAACYLTYTRSQSIFY